VPQDVDLAKVQSVPHGGQLFDEGVHHPKRWVVWVVGLSAPQLVVENDRAPGIRQLGQVFQVIVRRARTPVEHQKWQLAAYRRKVTYNLVPSMVPPKLNGSFLFACRAHLLTPCSANI
jgi:hypothetical protein